MIARTCVVAACLVVACARAPVAPAPAETPPSERLVLVVSIDGFPASSFADPRLPVPTLRRLAREGAAAERLVPVNPTTTWANHATLITGVGPRRHGVLHNGALGRAAPGAPLVVEPRVRHLPVRVPTLAEIAHARGLRAAHVGWLPPQSGAFLQLSFPDLPDPAGADERAAVRAGWVAPDELTGFLTAPVTARDEVWARIAAGVATSAAHPQLVLLHLLAADWLQHQQGPSSLSASAALALADARVGELLAAIARAGLAPRTTVFVVSDHGFRWAKRSIRPNAALAEAGLLTAAPDGAIAAARAQAFSFGGTALVYVEAGPDRGPLVAQARARLVALEGVDAVIAPDGYGAFGLPPPGDLARGDQGPDFVLVARPGFAFANAAAGPALVPIAPPIEPGHHGYPAGDPEMDGIFVAWGRGIRKGVRLGRIANVDVAPTVARALGFAMPQADGRPIEAVFTPASVAP